MRVDARDPGFQAPYFVFDVPRCVQLKYVVWVDTDLAQYAAHKENPSMPEMLSGDYFEVKQAKKIELVGRTFFIDPHEDPDAEDAETTPAMLDREVEHG